MRSFTINSHLHLNNYRNVFFSVVTMFFPKYIKKIIIFKHIFTYIWRKFSHRNPMGIRTICFPHLTGKLRLKGQWGDLPKKSNSHQVGNQDSTPSCMRQRHGVISSCVSSFPPETGSPTIKMKIRPHSPAQAPPPSHGLTYSQNSMTGEVKLVVLMATQRVSFLRRVSSMQCGVFQLWLQWAQGSSFWKDWNR